MVRITHLITGLGKGGAETAAYNVATGLSNRDMVHSFVSFGESHYYEKMLDEKGIKVIELPLRKRPVFSFFKLVKYLKNNTDVLYCWMYHANFVGYFAGKLARVKKIVWSIHHSDLSPENNNSLTLLINKLCAKISKKVDLITYCAEKSRSVHQAAGYCRENGTLLVNGVDCDIYKPDARAKENICKELGISTDAKIVLSVCRNHPIKDIPNFISAFGEFHKSHNNYVAVICGNGIVPENLELAGKIEAAGLATGKNIFLLGQRDDVPQLMAACDIYTLHSAGEAFPNVLIQAMACGCLCITTDVGDAWEILADDSFVVPAKSSHELCTAFDKADKLIASEVRTLKEKNRARAIEHFSLEKMLAEYKRILVINQ